MIARFKARFGRSTVAKALVAALIGTASVVGIAAPAQASNCATPAILADWYLPKGAYICEYGYTTKLYQGRMHIFVVGTDYTIYSTWQTAIDGPYVPHWTSLGGKGRSGITAITYKETASGRLVLALSVMGTDGNRWHKIYNYYVPNTWWPSQLGWSR
ncbi:hypothetical protein [Krasilnikovia sp. M28-CT-15]|uniref:hypothetical protein n=1 Tax=Krasilnikovia sp. M28-CT-15 TaxID=3373540 RepID=UPI003875D0D4